MFGKHPRGGEADRASLLVQAPSVVEVRLPAELVAGREFVTSASLDRRDGAEGSVQVQVLVDQPASENGVAATRPILVRRRSAARRKLRGVVRRFPPPLPRGPLLQPDRARR